MKFKHITAIENAPKLADWLKTRGGILVWPSVDFSSLGKSWTTPAKTTEGQDYQKPDWRCGTPELITDPNDVGVETVEEIARIPVCLNRRGLMGMKVVLTDASERKFNKKMAKLKEEHGDDIYAITGDLMFPEMIVLKPTEVISLAEWEKREEK